jgi:GT2 family glycosyltransferase/glycosyltransferase involved in cell wall biosynthesis
MFLILGSPRSGTTLLRATLNQHPAVLVPDETDLVVPVCMICERIKDEAAGRAMVADFVVGSDRYAFSIAPYLAPDDVRAVVSRAPYSGMAMTEALYDAIAERERKALAGDKSPNDLFFLGVLLRGGLLERPIKVIHLVRDVRDVVLSMSRTPFRPPFLDTAFPLDWNRVNLTLFRSMHDLPERYLLVRFDDMVLDTEATFRRVATFLGVSFYPGMLSHETRGMDKVEESHHQNLNKPMLSSRVAVWRREMAPERGRLIAGRAREALRQFGWEEPEVAMASRGAGAEAAAAAEEYERAMLRLQIQLDGQSRWARASAEEVSKRDRIIADLRESLKEQTEWAKASAAEVTRRDSMIVELQTSLKEQTRWARESAAGVAKRDETMADLRRTAREHAELIRAGAVRAAEQERLIAELGVRLEEAQRAHAEARGPEQQETIEIKTPLDVLQREVYELVRLLRRSVLDRVRKAFRSHAAGRPVIETLHPVWTEAGQRFNVQQDGRAHLAVEGSGFGCGAVLVVAGRPLETYHASGRLLSACVPDELFNRPGVLPVWVDNGQGARPLSFIRCFRVLAGRTAAACRPASGRWRRVKGAFNRLLWLASAVSCRSHLPLFRLQRGLAEMRKRRQARGGARRQRALPILSPEVAAHIKPGALPRKPDVICFPIIDWDFRYQRPQQILTRVAQAGHRVFYLNQRFLGAGEETFRLRPLVPGVTEVFLRSPSRLNVYRDSLAGEVEEALYRALLDVKVVVGLGETICFVHLPFWTPLALRLKADFGDRIVFDCLDDFSSFRNIGDRMRELEGLLAARADLVVASSRLLARKHATREPLLIPNATDHEHFSASRVPALPPAGPGPVLGYYGAISHWFDADLIAAAAGARPECRFVLIGRVDREIRDRLAGLPNILFRGEVPYADLPAHLAAFDACLIPFVVDDLIRATSPVKFFEYLSAGKPVVAARMPELLPFSEDCFLYEGLPEFLGQVDKALGEKDHPARIAARRAVAMANTWERRVDALCRAFPPLYPRASVVVVTYNGLEMTRACLESLLEKTAYGDWELIVVDNGSSDGTPDYLRALSERQPSVRIVLNDSNRGFAPANNQGIRAATGEFLVLLNNDTVVTQGWLGRLLRHLDDRGVGLVGPVTNNIGNEAQIETDYPDMAGMEDFAERYSRTHAGRAFDIPMLAMFCLAMRRALVDEVGMLDERYEIGMFEDDDFSRSVKARGLRIVCAEDVFVHHVGGGSFGKLAPEVYRRIFEANQRRYEDKWGETWAPHRYRPQAAD